MKFLASFAIFALLWLPVVIIGLPITFLLLLTPWKGYTTWFGNHLYGRMGNAHTPSNPDLFDQWWFLAIRNPVSNFGKYVINTYSDTSWAWLEDRRLFGRFYILYGWKNPDQRIEGRRPFVFRPFRK